MSLDASANRINSIHLFASTGEGLKEHTIGELSTNVGQFKMAVAYRTKMTISPTQPIRDTGLMLKSDHFNELTPKAQIRYHVKKPYVIRITASVAFALWMRPFLFNKKYKRPFSFIHSISEYYSEKRPIDIEKPLLTGAFVDPSKITQYTETDYILPEIPPLTWLIKNPKVTPLYLSYMRHNIYNNQVLRVELKKN